MIQRQYKKIHFTGNLDKQLTTFFIIEQTKETV